MKEKEEIIEINNGEVAQSTGTGDGGRENPLKKRGGDLSGRGDCVAYL